MGLANGWMGWIGGYISGWMDEARGFFFFFSCVFSAYGICPYFFKINSFIFFEKRLYLEEVIDLWCGVSLNFLNTQDTGPLSPFLINVSIASLSVRL